MAGLLQFVIQWYNVQAKKEQFMHHACLLDVENPLQIRIMMVLYIIERNLKLDNLEWQPKQGIQKRGNIGPHYRKLSENSSGNTVIGKQLFRTTLTHLDLEHFCSKPRCGKGTQMPTPDAS